MARRSMMEEICKIPFTPHLNKISMDIHQDLTKFLKIRSPKAKLFSEDPDVEQLYCAWILIRSGMVKFLEEDGYISVKSDL